MSSSLKKQIRIAIIGSMGSAKHGDKALYTKELWLAMVEKAKSYLFQAWIQDWTLVEKVTLISGGSAFADHVAVEVFKHWKEENKPVELQLFLTTPFDKTYSQFDESEELASNNQYMNRGKHTNRSFDYFSKVMERDMIKDFAFVQNMYPNEVHFRLSERGFKDRDRMIARTCSHMLAFTFQEGPAPKPGGGTAYTWSQCFVHSSLKHHVSLLTLQQDSQKKITSFFFGSK